MTFAPTLTGIATIVLAWLALATTAQAAEPQFLGRSLADWRTEAKSSDSSIRLHAIWALSQQPAAALPELMTALSDRDAAARFWAVQGLARLAADHQTDETLRTKIAATLIPLLQDAAPSPRIAAAEALARLNKPAPALRVLMAALTSEPQDAARTAAAEAIERLGPLAAGAEPALEQAAADQGEYAKRISTRALRSLKKTPLAVP